MKVVKSATIEGSKTMETWQEQQKAVATGVTIPAQESSSYTYVSVIEDQLKEIEKLEEEFYYDY